MGDVFSEVKCLSGAFHYFCWDVVWGSLFDIPIWDTHHPQKRLGPWPAPLGRWGGRAPVSKKDRKRSAWEVTHFAQRPADLHSSIAHP